jgi:hypothetical protein
MHKHYGRFEKISSFSYLIVVLIWLVDLRGRGEVSSLLLLSFLGNQSYITPFYGGLFLPETQAWNS